MKLNELYELFLSDKEIDVFYSTIETIQRRYSVISRYYSNTDIEDINKQSIRKYQKYLLEVCQYSVAHVNNLIGLLKQLIAFAFDNGYLKINTISGVIMINKKVKLPKEKVIWNLEQFLKFDGVISDFHDKLIFNMLFYLGVRKGELLSLKWNEINFASRTIKIISTANRKKGIGQIVTPPKTACSNRLLSVNESLFILLEKYYIIQKKKYGNEINEIFVIGNEKMMSFTSLQRLLNKYLAKTDLPRICLHGFRHSHATMLAEISTDIKAISQRLGHDSIEITVNTYIHTNSKAQVKLSNCIEDNIKRLGQNNFEIFIDMMNKILRKEIVNNEYNDKEMKCIINMYNYIQKEVVII